MIRIVISLFLALIIVSIIIIYYRYYYDDCYPLDKSYNNPYPLKCCILLTMYIGKNNKKRNIYIDRLNKWLNNTDFDIYIVESSGEILNIKNTRLYQYSFDQNKDKLNLKNSTILEKNSIIKAYQNFKDKFKNYDFIFKITGKYYIPSLEKIIKNIKFDTDIIFQNRGFYNIQNTEITGYRSSLIYDITNQVKDNLIYEEQIRDIQRKNGLKAYRLPPLKLNDYTERGDGNILKFL